MKLLFIIIVFICLIVFFVTRGFSKTGSADSPKVPRTGFLTSFAVLMLRLVLVFLGLAFILGCLFAVKTAIVVSNPSRDGTFDFLNLLAAVAALYIPLWAFSRIYRKINQMRREYGVANICQLAGADIPCEREQKK